MGNFNRNGEGFSLGESGPSSFLAPTQALAPTESAGSAASPLGFQQTQAFPGAVPASPQAAVPARVDSGRLLASGAVKGSRPYGQAAWTCEASSGGLTAGTSCVASPFMGLSFDHEGGPTIFQAAGLGDGRKTGDLSGKKPGRRPDKKAGDLCAGGPNSDGQTRPQIAVVPDWLTSVQGFTTHPVYLLRRNYLAALIQAGGLPVVVDYAHNCVEAFLDRCAGLVLIGGDHTVDPALFGQPNTSKLPLNPQRVDAEQVFFHSAFSRQMPILGICAGMQLMNVLLGGTLIQDLPSQRPQALVHTGMHTHPISVTAHTRLWQAVGQPDKPYEVNTSHRQAADQVGPQTRVTAQAPDGIIEAIEATNHPFCLGVQWHPEYAQPPHPDTLLLKAFVQACRHFSRG